MYKASSQRFGFTIVELLVVIVVIGVLAAITIVSYTGISQRAVASSLQSDLTNAVKKLKMYSVDNGTYPQSLDANNCPVGPADNRYCLKASSGNTLSYCPVAPYSIFGIKSTNTNGLVFTATDNSPPVQSSPSSAIFSSGGTITSSGCYRTHSFVAPSTYNLTAATSGTVIVTVNGAGGSSDNVLEGAGGAGGGYSSVTHNSTSYIAAGGGACASSYGTAGGTGGIGLGYGGGAGGAAGNATSCGPGDGGAGGGNPYTMALASGGGGAGGLRNVTCGNYPGGAGGGGGKLLGMFERERGPNPYRGSGRRWGWCRRIVWTYVCRI